MMNKRKGISLIEVVISFVLVSILIVMVSGSVVSSYQLAAQIQKLPVVYYAGQQEVEDKLAELEELMERKYLLKQTIDAQYNVTPAFLEEYNSILSELGNESKWEHVTISVFDQQVEIYQFELEHTIEDVGSVHFYAGTASGVRYERKVPTLNYVEVKVNQTRPVALYDAVGKQLTATTTYVQNDNLIYSYSDGDHFLWYTSPSVPTELQSASMTEEELNRIIVSNHLHSVYYTDGTVFGTVGAYNQGIIDCMPCFPNDFTGIYATESRTSTYTVTENDLGKFICCEVTPQANNGALGRAVYSNLIYLSALPVLQNKYMAVLDPSLMSNREESTHVVRLGKFNSWVPNTTNAFFRNENNQNHAYLHQEGAATSEAYGFKSRYISIDAGNNDVTSNITKGMKDSIYMVVRDTSSGNNSRFITANNSPDTLALGKTEDGHEWKLIYFLNTEIQSGNNANYKLIGQYDLAELIIARELEEPERTAITDYLIEKYGLTRQ